jgi:hypothetical protein
MEEGLAGGLFCLILSCEEYHCSAALRGLACKQGGGNMSKHKSAEEKLHVQPVRAKAPASLPDSNNPSLPLKRTNANNQYR